MKQTFYTKEGAEMRTLTAKEVNTLAKEGIIEARREKLKEKIQAAVDLEGKMRAVLEYLQVVE